MRFSLAFAVALAAAGDDYEALRFVSEEDQSRLGISTLARKILEVAVIW